MKTTQTQMRNQEMAVASLERLINNHHDFFNFINVHDGWNRWVSGRYTLNEIDNMGETLCNVLEKFWRKHQLHLSKTMSSDRLLVVDYKGAYFLLRKLDGKENFAAINLIEGIYNFRILSWERLHKFLREELAAMSDVEIETKKNSLVIPVNIYAKQS